MVIYKLANLYFKGQPLLLPWLRRGLYRIPAAFLGGFGYFQGPTGISCYYQWMDEWMDEWMNEWMNECKDEWMKGWMNESMNEWKDEWKDEWMKGWMKGWMKEWINEWTNEYIRAVSPCPSSSVLISASFSPIQDMVSSAFLSNTCTWIKHVLSSSQISSLCLKKNLVHMQF